MATTASAASQVTMQLADFTLSAACPAAMRAAVKLGIPDVLGEGGATINELATAVAANQDALGRLLRSLTCYGVFAEKADGRYVHTEASRLLREDAPHSLKHLVLWCTEPWTWELWGHLEEAIRTGKDVFTGLHGKELFELPEWPESAKVYDLAMTQASKASAMTIAEKLTMSDVRTVADIGGGQGYMLAMLLERHPALQGILLDRPDAVANADPRLRAGGELAGRVRLLPGDCRKEIPIQADTYIFKNVLVWEDETTALVLRNAVKAARPGARVVIVDNIIDGGPGRTFATAMDLRMLLIHGGKQHTKDGLLALVEQSGLILQNLQVVNSYLHMIEATVPA